MSNVNHELKEFVVSVRFTITDREDLRELVKANGYHRTSDYIRALLEEPLRRYRLKRNLQTRDFRDHT